MLGASSWDGRGDTNPAFVLEGEHGNYTFNYLDFKLADHYSTGAYPSASKRYRIEATGKQTFYNNNDSELLVINPTSSNRTTSFAIKSPGANGSVVKKNLIFTIHDTDWSSETGISLPGNTAIDISGVNLHKWLNEGTTSRNYIYSPDSTSTLTYGIHNTSTNSGDAFFFNNSGSISLGANGFEKLRLETSGGKITGDLELTGHVDLSGEGIIFNSSVAINYHQ
jgi:hypothetical protein